MASKRIVAIDARLFGGQSTGDSTYWTGLIRALLQSDDSISYLLFSNTPKPAEIPSGEKFRWIQLNHRNSRLWSLVHFPLAARRLGASAIHTQYSLSPLAGRNGITTIHDVSFFIGPHWFGKKDRLILQRSIPGSARRAAAILTVSQSSKAEIEHYIPAATGKVFATPLACPDWIQAVPRNEAKGIVADKLGLTEPYVLSVSTRWPRKNMELAVAAMEGLTSSLPHRLVLTGKAGWGDQSVGSRTFATGYVDQSLLGALYSAADLYLCPSLHEGFGLPLLEAFRCGCPVLCTSKGALPEVAGDAALVMPDEIPANWSAAIENLLSSSGKLEQLATKGRERESQFSWQQTAAETRKVYERVLG